MCLVLLFFLSVFLQWLNLNIQRFPSLQILSSFWFLIHFMPGFEGIKKDFFKKAFPQAVMQSSFGKGNPMGAKELEI